VSDNKRHAFTIAAITIAGGLAADLVIWFVWKPHLPPGAMSTSAQGQQFDIAVLAISGAPVLIGVLTYFLYSVITWHAKRGDLTDGAPIRGNTKVAAIWIIVTSATVMWAFAFGTVQLITTQGAGSGQGPQPIWKLDGDTSETWTPGTNDMLQVQAIGQQWTWTFRYPQFGGMETSVLYLPIDTPIEFHVTSLDVVHSFWAYYLGVKADANPQVDNIAYTTIDQRGDFRVQCSELCGIWHGAMFNQGAAVGQAAFEAWAHVIRQREEADGLLAALPAYSLTYDPTVIPRLNSGNNLNKVDGITGAAGYYYPPSDPVTP
jgi:cytochrome c oxidase subunit 2